MGLGCSALLLTASRGPQICNVGCEAARNGGVWDNATPRLIVIVDHGASESLSRAVQGSESTRYAVV